METLQMVEIPTGLPEFRGFPKVSRFSRAVVITEKIDGTNASVMINDRGDGLIAGSRTRWITPAMDNHGFAKWVQANRDELLTLGPGTHFGEWWGSGIQRGYGLKEKKFSLFNVAKWRGVQPKCCDVVPVLWEGSMDDIGEGISASMDILRKYGSFAAPCFMRPEGIVIYHTAGGVLFKKTLEKDEVPKGFVEK